nr:PLDc_N domain-containing protein [Actinomycetales bacterium]
MQPLAAQLQLSDIPTWGWILIGVYSVVHFGLAILAIVTITRTPRERLNGPPVVWILVSLLVQIIGPVLFFAAGRRPAAAVDPLAHHAEVLPDTGPITFSGTPGTSSGPRSPAAAPTASGPPASAPTASG